MLRFRRFLVWAPLVAAIVLLIDLNGVVDLFHGQTDLRQAAPPLAARSTSAAPVQLLPAGVSVDPFRGSGAESSTSAAQLDLPTAGVTPSLGADLRARALHQVASSHASAVTTSGRIAPASPTYHAVQAAAPAAARPAATSSSPPSVSEPAATPQPVSKPTSSPTYPAAEPVKPAKPVKPASQPPAPAPPPLSVPSSSVPPADPSPPASPGAAGQVTSADQGQSSPPAAPTGDQGSWTQPTSSAPQG